MIEIRRLGLTFKLPLEATAETDLAALTRGIALLRSRLSGSVAVRAILGRDPEPIGRALESLENLGIEILAESRRAGARADGRPR